MIILSVFALLILSACKTSRSVTKTQVTEGSPVAQLIAKVQAAQPQFKTANVSKMSMEFNMNERNVNVSATCKIQKDSVIYLSIQPFMGIEMFKAEIMTDKIVVFDKMNRKYYQTDYAWFKSRFGVDIDFNSLQALIFNQFFCVGKKEILPDSCKLTPLASGRNKIEYETLDMLQITETGVTNTIQQVLLKGKNTSYQLQANYEDFSVINAVNFPQTVKILATNEKTKVNCNFSILKVEFNTDLKFIPSNTERYSPGDIDQLLKKQ